MYELFKAAITLSGRRLGYGLDVPRNRGSITDRGKEFNLFSKRPDRLCRPPGFLISI